GRAGVPLGSARAPGARGRPGDAGTRRRFRSLLGHAPARCACGGRGEPAIAPAGLARRAAGARGRDGHALRRRGPASAALGRLPRVGRARGAVGRPARARARPCALDAHAHTGRRSLRGWALAPHAVDAMTPDALAVAERVPLGPLTTLGVGGTARWL